MRLHARNMADQHPMGMQRALGRPRRAGGEDHHRRIFQPADDLERGIGKSVDQRLERGVVARFAVSDHEAHEIGQIGADGSDLAGTGLGGDQQLRARGLQPVAERLDPEEQRQRHGDGAHLVERDMGDHG